jgi:hypothetical protein
MAWRKREIENYLCRREILLRFAQTQATAEGPLFEQAEKSRRTKAMEEAIAEIEAASASLGRPSPWSDDCKVSDEFLAPVFTAYSKRLAVPLCLRKSEYARLAALLQRDEVNPEIVEKLDAIADVASRATACAE